MRQKKPLTFCNSVYNGSQSGEISMKGNIYTDQKCPVCDGKLVHNERKGGCFCKDHPKIAATARFRVKYGREIHRRFDDYQTAIRFLTGIRFRDDEGTLDTKDYRADCPYAFDRLAYEYLKEKTHLKSYRHTERFMESAIEFFGCTNVKAIKGPDFKRFLKTLKYKPKTKDNCMAVIKNFFRWYLVEEEILQPYQLPRFPKIEYEMGWRKLVDWETQDKILEHLKETETLKTWLAVDMLRTYTTLRPGDIRKIRKCDIDFKNHVITIYHPTKLKDKWKVVRILPEHMQIIEQLEKQYPSFPDVLFFRHTHGKPWGHSRMYDAWKRACNALGIDGVDLYGGTRHSTTTELAKSYGETAAKEATGHQTNKAFNRYCQVQGERAYQMAQVVRSRKKKHG